MKILGAPLSPFVRKVMIYCREREIAFELKPIFPAGDGLKDPEFVLASPLLKIPAIQDGDFNLADSSAIIHYLEAKHGAALLPTQAEDHGRAVFFDKLTDGSLMPAIGPAFFNRVVAPNFLGMEGDLAAADAAEKDLVPPILEKIEKLVPENSEFLVGDSLTIGDISLASAFMNADYAGISVDPKSYPKLAAWLAKTWERPSFTAQKEMEGKLLPQ